MSTTVLIEAEGQQLAMQFGDKTEIRFHAIWLRDNAQDGATRSPQNGQKLISLVDIPTNLTIQQANIIAGNTLQLVFSPEAHETHFPIDWLTAQYNSMQANHSSILPDGIKTWNDQFQNDVYQANWTRLTEDTGALKKWLSALRTFGVVKLSGTPTTSGTILDIAALFGYVRETNYGKWFEVRSEVKPVNLAYTGLGLKPHTDNPYRDPIPTMQILHCLENSADGGDSIVVDGFHCAQQLLQEHPEDFELLCNYSARFEYNGSDGIHLTATRPILEMSPERILKAIRFNNRSIAPLLDIPFDVLPQYYRALGRLESILYDESMQVSFRLAPGECFIVDNTRVLHARTAFTGTGNRWLQGCYPDIDGLHSKIRSLP